MSENLQVHKIACVMFKSELLSDSAGINTRRMSFATERPPAMNLSWGS
jgi:hypothetical protein